MAIRNPSKEELEALKKGKVEPLISNPIEKESTAQIKQIWNAEECKPKKSKFEPDHKNFIYLVVKNL